MTNVTSGVAKRLHARILAVAVWGVVGWCVVASSGEASTIGVSFTGATTPNSFGDGQDVINIQTQHAVPGPGTIDSFTYLAGSTLSTKTEAFLIVRPTGITNQYSVVFDSGNIQAASTGLQTFSITPTAVVAGDLIAAVGQGVKFDNGVLGTDNSLYAFGSPSLRPTSSPFTIGAAPYGSFSSTAASNRSYYFQANFTPAPEPSSIALLVMGASGLGLMARHRRVARAKS